MRGGRLGRRRLCARGDCRTAQEARTCPERTPERSHRARSVGPGRVGRASSFCGSLGAEIAEPLTFRGREGSARTGERGGYADESLKPAGGDWEKYLCTYRLWGRLLYNSDADPDMWRRFLRGQYGPAAAPAEAALAFAASSFFFASSLMRSLRCRVLSAGMSLSSWGVTPVLATNSLIRLFSSAEGLNFPASDSSHEGKPAR